MRKNQQQKNRQKKQRKQIQHYHLYCLKLCAHLFSNLKDDIDINTEKYTIKYRFMVTLDLLAVYLPRKELNGKDIIVKI